jgi:hypothetical protein
VGAIQLRRVQRRARGRELVLISVTPLMSAIAPLATPRAVLHRNAITVAWIRQRNDVTHKNRRLGLDKPAEPNSVPPCEPDRFELTDPARVFRLLAQVNGARRVARRLRRVADGVVDLSAEIV